MKKMNGYGGGKKGGKKGGGKVPLFGETGKSCPSPKDPKRPSN